MNAPRWVKPALVVLLAMGVGTCGDSTGNDKPTTGWLSLSLATPNADDGGILFTVSGARIDSIRSTHPHVLLNRESASSVRVVIAGDLSAGVIGEILVPDTRAAAQYTGVVHEVAARATYQQRPPTGYTVTVKAAVR
jgi:hypothetical protein